MEIKLKITGGKDQALYLTAKTMNELVDKIVEWQDYDDYVKTMNQFKNKPTEEKLKKEKESGWYYIKQLALFSGSPLRELLLKYENYTSEIITGKTNDRTAKSLVDGFLANNCVQRLEYEF